MKNIYLSKVAAVVVVLIVAAISLTTAADVKRRIKIVGPDAKTTLQVFDTSNVSYIEVAEVAGETEEAAQYVYPNATIAKNGDLLIELTPELIFRMVRVEGGVDYALQSTTISWTSAEKTKSMETFYLGQFEVTQGLWRNIMGSVPASQSATGDNYPVALVSWDMIAGSQSDSFLKLINTKLADIKQNNPTIATLLGNREFRLPSEWEWEYAAAGGKNWEKLNYYFSGTAGSTPADLQTVAVNSVSPNSASTVAPVGSKLPNALGLYDMSGNVWEWCSGLGYPGYDNINGFMRDSKGWIGDNRPGRGGCIGHTDSQYYRVSFRNNTAQTVRIATLGFRLAL